jgi:hypothetical protein
MEEPRPAKLSDDELLARYPEEASMIVVCGVPREEIQHKLIKKIQ